MTEPRIPTEADVVRTLAVLDCSLGRCACGERPGIVSDVNGQALCAECAAACSFDDKGDYAQITPEQIVAGVVAGMTDVERAVLNNPDRTTRFCRRCGCTAFNACMDERGPCWWVEADLCSHCVDGSGHQHEEAFKAVAQMHPDDVAVYRFAGVLVETLKVERETLGRTDWDDPEISLEELWQIFYSYATSDDILNIGKLAMMIWNRREMEAAASAARRAANGQA